MILQISAPEQTEVIYPDCDGQPVANNTIQFRWLVEIKQNLDYLFINDPNVFVAGDLFWYPVEGKNTIVTAPDVLVVLGRPKIDRLSYLQWREDNIPPQVVFEILSPSNTKIEMEKKLLFYDRYGVQEYYIYDPENNDFQGWLRGEDILEPIPPTQEYISPLLKIRFLLTDETLEIYHPDGKPFASYDQIVQEKEQEKQRAEQEKQRAEKAEQARKDAIPKLLAMGLSVEQVAEALSLAVEEVTTMI
ncbi:Uma2 family endonuclease [Sphaerospermopsis torques-reginae]|jgi:Uma2 family endonuclease|uniref:Uma2 family endonuclease n=1 Tax=Sphaerospermopsis torques-reginae ITEP-024 TaxID=984208 RepID=A0ABX8WXN0_9CYAN|nr:Uma2 family endonuclease [Sphaerospermopsis torques-reginae]QYX31196.1 Uma2 family endonuclease [Sphaerospermopsis torques-reginae ITEP-024]